MPGPLHIAGPGAGHVLLLGHVAARVEGVEGHVGLHVSVLLVPALQLAARAADGVGVAGLLLLLLVVRILPWKILSVSGRISHMRMFPKPIHLLFKGFI